MIVKLNRKFLCECKVCEYMSEILHSIEIFVSRHESFKSFCIVDVVVVTQWPRFFKSTQYCAARENYIEL